MAYRCRGEPGRAAIPGTPTSADDPGLFVIRGVYLGVDGTWRYKPLPDAET